MSLLDSMVGRNEEILWRGKPSKKCFVLESVINPFMFFALVWLVIDLTIMATFLFLGETVKVNGQIVHGSRGAYFMIPFFALHMMPVWIYLGSVVMTFKRYRNTEYIVTDKGVYVSGGVFHYTTQMKPFAEISRVQVHRGIFDQRLGVGDVILDSMSTPSIQFGSCRVTGQVNAGVSIIDIPDYEEVFHLVKEVQEAVYTDVMYPNELRPKINRGYKTKLKRKKAKKTS